MGFIRVIIVSFFILISLIKAEASQGDDMNDVYRNTLTLFSEVQRIGYTQKWNSSQFLQGPLRINVLKDGTVTDRGIYILTKEVLGYPAAIRVSKLKSKHKKYIVAVSPPSRSTFPKDLYIKYRDLKALEFDRLDSKILQKDRPLYADFNDLDNIYVHRFVNHKGDQKIDLEIYSRTKDVEENISFFRVVFLFNQ